MFGFLNVIEKLNLENELKKQLKELKQMDVLVGIPNDKGERQSSKGKKYRITNYELLYIHTHGVRHKSMRAEMQKAMDAGKPYSAAYDLYIRSHGSPLWNIPPRPVIEPAIQKHKEKISEKLGKAAKMALSGQIEMAKNQLAKTGEFAASKVQNYFEDDSNSWTPNSPETIKRKGSSRPLIDTGAMRNAITYVVRGKNE